MSKVSAAKKVFKSQAAVSIQIATLEERAGLTFFDRSERPLKTESGKLFLSFCVEFLNKLGGLDRLLKELASGISGEVKLAALYFRWNLFTAWNRSRDSQRLSQVENYNISAAMASTL